MLQHYCMRVHGLPFLVPVQFKDETGSIWRLQVVEDVHAELKSHHGGVVLQERGATVQVATQEHVNRKVEQDNVTHCRQHGHFERLGSVWLRHVGESLDHEAQQQACKKDRTQAFSFSVSLQQKIMVNLWFTAPQKWVGWSKNAGTSLQTTLLLLPIYPKVNLQRATHDCKCLALRHTAEESLWLTLTLREKSLSSCRPFQTSSVTQSGCVMLCLVCSAATHKSQPVSGMRRG